MYVELWNMIENNIDQQLEVNYLNRSKLSKLEFLIQFSSQSETQVFESKSGQQTNVRASKSVQSSIKIRLTSHLFLCLFSSMLSTFLGH